MRPLFIPFSAILIGITSCGEGILHEYLNADSSIWTHVPMHVDSADYAEVTLQENGSMLNLTVLYGCDESLISRLHNMQVDLIVEGQVVEPDKFKVSASYANTYADLNTSNWCDSLTQKLGIDSTQYMESFAAGIVLTQVYSGLSRFPTQPSVRFTSETAGGNSDTTIVLTLRSSKDTRAPIRVH